MHQMIESIVNNLADIKKACELLCIDFLTVKELEAANDFLCITSIMKELILMFEADKECTISKCIPYLISLINKLKKFSKPEVFYASNLIKDINARLETILDPEHPDFNIAYSLAVMLDNNTNKSLMSPALAKYKVVAENYLASKLNTQISSKNVEFDGLELDMTNEIEENSELKM